MYHFIIYLLLGKPKLKIVGLKVIKLCLGERSLFSKGDMDLEREMKKELCSTFWVKPRMSINSAMKPRFPLNGSYSFASDLGPAS